MEELKKNYDLKEKGKDKYAINEKIECVLDTKELWKIEKVEGYNLQSIEKYYEFLKESNREKDKVRIPLIEKYIKKGEITNMNTIIYLIKHAEELEEKGIKNTNESSQLMNEKYILSVKGEEQAKELSENPELQNIDILWSSSYSRAKGTAKYITYKNNIDINIDSNLNERKLGNIEDLAKWMEGKKYGVVQSYLLDRRYKGRDGESCEEATQRVSDFLNFILEDYKGKRIALVSHGALLSFLLTNWCELNEDVKLIWNNKIIEIKEPSITKLTFDDGNLINIESINI